MGCFDRTVWVKVEGKGSFSVSAGLKEFVVRMIDRGFADFVVDLRLCEMMDSTFMGTLAGAALRLRENGEGSLKVVNANTRNRDLLAGLGLDQIFEVSETPADEPEPARMAPAPKASGEDEKETVLEAHEALAEADSANAAKFKDVIEFLKQEIDQSGGDSREEV